MTEYSNNINKMRATGDFHHHHHNHQMCAPSYSSLPSASSDIAVSTNNEAYIIGPSTLGLTTNVSYSNNYTEMISNSNEPTSVGASVTNAGIFSNFYHQQPQTEYIAGAQFISPNGSFMTSTSGYSYGLQTQQPTVWTMDGVKKSSPPMIVNGYSMAHDDTNTTSSSVTTGSSSGSSTPTALTNLNNCNNLSQQLLKTSDNNATLLTNLALAESSIQNSKKEENKSNNVNSKTATNLKQLNRSKQLKEEMQFCESDNNTSSFSNKLKPNNRFGKYPQKKRI